MFSYNKSDNFFKIDNIIFAKDDISIIDCSDIEMLEVEVTLKNGNKIKAYDIHALELVMQTRPSVLEGKRLVWGKFMWCFHNIVAHPLLQFFSLIKMYKLGFWIHDVTVPRPLLKIKKKND